MFAQSLFRLSRFAQTYDFVHFEVASLELVLARVLSLHSIA
jgi:hypothetical protein